MEMLLVVSVIIFIIGCFMYFISWYGNYRENNAVEKLKDWDILISNYKMREYVVTIDSLDKQVKSLNDELNNYYMDGCDRSIVIANIAKRSDSLIYNINRFRDSFSFYLREYDFRMSHKKKDN